MVRLLISTGEVSGDLQHCKIFISLFGEEKKKKEVLACLEEAKGFFRAELARRLQMRRAPDIVFKLDLGMTKGSSVLDLLTSLESKRKSKNNNIENF